MTRWPYGGRPPSPTSLRTVTLFWAAGTVAAVIAGYPAVAVFTSVYALSSAYLYRVSRPQRGRRRAAAATAWLPPSPPPPRSDERDL